MAPRLVHGVIAALTDLCTASAAWSLLGRRAWAPTLMLSLTAWFHWHSLPRPLINSLETALVAAALALWPWHGAEPSARGKPGRPASRAQGGSGLGLSGLSGSSAGAASAMTVAGLGSAGTASLAASLFLGGLACAARPTAVLVFLPLGMLLLASQPTLPRAAAVAALAAACVGLACALGAALDTAAYGEPSWSVASFLRFNLTAGLSRLYGASGWWRGLLLDAPLLLGPALPLTVAGAAGVLNRAAARARSLARAHRAEAAAQPRPGRTAPRFPPPPALPEEAWPLVCAACAALGLSLSPHLETRFLHPLLPLLLPYAGAWICGLAPERGVLLGDAAPSAASQGGGGGDDTRADDTANYGGAVGGPGSDLRRRGAADRAPEAVDAAELAAELAASPAERDAGAEPDDVDAGGWRPLAGRVAGEVDSAVESSGTGPGPAGDRASRRAATPLLVRAGLWRPGGFAVPSAVSLVLMASAVLAVVAAHAMKTGPVLAVSRLRAESGPPGGGAMDVHVWGSCHSTPGLAALHRPGARMLYLSCSPGARLADEEAAAGAAGGGLSEGGSLAAAWYRAPAAVLRRVYGQSWSGPRLPGPAGAASGPGGGRETAGWIRDDGVSSSAVTLDGELSGGVGGAPRLPGVPAGSVPLPSHVVVWSGSLERVRGVARSMGFEIAHAVAHNPVARLLGLDRSAEGEDVDDTSSRVVVLRHRAWGAWAAAAGLPPGVPL